MAIKQTLDAYLAAREALFVRASRLTANISGPWSQALARTERASPVRKIDPDAASGQTRQRG